MVSHAKRMGANAIVGVRYDTGPMVGAAEVLCYGTAVIVEPIHPQSLGAQPGTAAHIDAGTQNTIR